MGQINKWANLYDKDGQLIRKAPLKSQFKQEPPHSTKYPGASFSRAQLNAQTMKSTDATVEA